MAADAPFEFIRRPPSTPLRGVVRTISGYRETGAARAPLIETAALVVPVLVSFGSDFKVALDRVPGPTDAWSSFVAGLHSGPAHVRSDGAAACVQADLTPLGAYRLFGGVLAELADQMVDLRDVLGDAASSLEERLAATANWHARLDAVEALLQQGERYQPSPEIAWAYQRLHSARGHLTIRELAQDIGWSRTRLATRFKAALGLGPKAVGRLMRLRHAQRLALASQPDGWASIAAACGYADQAHMSREFQALAGEPPRAWRRRVNAEDTRTVVPAWEAETD